MAFIPLMLLLAVVGGLAYRLISPDERARYLVHAMTVVQRLKVAATEPGPEFESFCDALRARTAHPFVTLVLVAVNVAVFGLYGLLLASLIWQTLERRERDPEGEAEESGNAALTIPPVALMRLGGGAAVFVLYSMFSGLASTAEFAGLVAGLAYGLVLA